MARHALDCLQMAAALLSTVFLVVADSNAAPMIVNGKPLPSAILQDTVSVRSSSMCTFTDGQAVGNRSFALFSVACPSVLISNATFVNGRSSAFGGCILLENVTSVTIEGSFFMGCGARLAGGGIAIIPFDLLTLVVKTTTFSSVTATFVGEITNEVVAGAGAALYVGFQTEGNFSSFIVEDVNVNHFGYSLNSSTSTFYPTALTGGAFLFHWPLANSGHSVQASFRGVSFIDGIADLQANYYINCGLIMPCAPPSLLVSFMWAGDDSGDDFQLELAHFSVLSCSLTSITPTSTFVGASWQGGNSGNGLIASISSTFVRDSLVGSGAGLFSMMWHREQSGSRGSLSLEGNISVTNTVFDSLSTGILRSWFARSSGNDVELMIHNANISVSECSFSGDSSIFFSSLWQETDSGNNVSISSINAHLEVQRTSFAVDGSFFCCHWAGSQAANRLSFSSIDSSWLAESCFFREAASFFQLELFGSSSGNDMTITLQNSSMSALHSSFGIEALFFGLGVTGESSGNRLSLLANNAEWSAVGVNFQNFSSFMIWYWLNVESGNDVTVIATESTWMSYTSIFGHDASFFSAVWYSALSGNNVAFQLDRSRLELSSTSLGELVTLYGMGWGGTNSGVNSSMIWRESSVLLEEIVVVESRVLGINMNWGQGASSNNSAFVFESTSLSVLQCFLRRVPVIVMSFHAASPSANFTLKLVDSPIIVKDTDGKSNGTIVSVFEPPHNMLFKMDSPTVIVNSTLQSVTELFAGYELKDLDCSLRNVKLFNSTVQSLSQFFIASIGSSSLSVEDVVLEQSSSTGISVNLDTSLVVDGVPSELPSLQWYADVSHIEGHDSNWLGMVLDGASSTIPMEATLGFSAHTFSGGKYGSCSLSAPGAALRVRAEITNIAIVGASSQLVFMEGTPGEITIGGITLDTVTVEQSLMSFLMYDSKSSCNVTLADLEGNFSATATAYFVRVLGGINLDIQGSVCIDLDWTNTSLPIFSLESGIEFPRLLTESPGLLSLRLSRYGGQARVSTVQMLSLPAGGFEIEGYFVDASAPSASRSSYSYRRPTNLRCPTGYTFQYSVDVAMAFYDPYTQPPFNCLNPFFATVSTCQRPVFAADVVCIPCPRGLISFNRGLAATATVKKEASSGYKASTEELTRCQPCPSAFLCDGGPADVVVTSGHWVPLLISLWEAKHWGAPSLQDMVVQCPSGACSPETPLVFRSGDVVSGSLCTEGRAAKSPLCSTCEQNHSAAFLTQSCIPDCQWSGRQAVFIVGVSALVIGYALFLLFKPISPQSPWIRIVTYFYSVLTLLYQTNGNSTKEIVMQVVAAVSTFQWFASGGTSPVTAVCIPGSQPIDLRLAQLVVPLLLMVFFTAAYLLRQAVTRKNEGQRLVAGLFSILLITYSSIAGTVFALLPCADVPIRVDNDTFSQQNRLFLHAEWLCWTATPLTGVVLILGLALVLGVPLGLFIWQGLFPSDGRLLDSWLLKQLRCTSRKSWKGVTALSLFEGNLRVWYWDAFLFVRRASLELIAVFVPRGIAQQGSFVAICVAYFGFHIAARPYISSTANKLEAFSLFILVVVASLNLPSTFIEAVATSIGPFEAFLAAVRSGQSWIAFIGVFVLLIVVGVVYAVRTVAVLQKKSRSTKGLCSSRKRRFSTSSSFSDKSRELQENLLMEEQDP